MEKKSAVRRVISVASWLLIGVIAWVFWPVSLGGCTSVIIVNGESMLPTLHAGDLVVARCGEPKINDVIIYKPFEGNPVTIIHRLNGGNGQTGWTARGDNNTFDDPFNFTSKNVVGTMMLNIPKAGFILAFLTGPLFWLTLALGAIAFYLWPSSGAEATTDEDENADEDENELAA